MNRPLSLASLLAFLIFAPAAHCVPPLQLFVDLTPAGGVLRPPPGTYAGPVVISRTMTIDGGNEVVIDGGGRGTVLTVRGDDVTVRNLRLTGSGESHDQVDAGILLEGQRARVENNRIDDTLFGIHIKQSDGNVVRGNRISSSKGTDFNLRGDGIRMWYSRENLLEGNEVTDSRDLLFANSTDNRIIGNTVRRGRVGMQFVFSPANLVENNTVDGNTTGFVVLYSDELTIRRNQVLHARSFAGSAMALKDSVDVIIEENDILHCAVGLEANSPTHPENVFHLRRNRFAYNDIALYFYGEKGGHEIHDNRFEHNLVQVAVSAPTAARANDWRGNYWDDYEGFDRDLNGTGDTPHELYAYADRIWMDRPMARFFRGSPVLELIDFSERLAPFSEPALILRDPVPRVPQ